MRESTRTAWVGDSDSVGCPVVGAFPSRRLLCFTHNFCTSTLTRTWESRSRSRRSCGSARGVGGSQAT